MASDINPRFPVYIISKGRWESRLTSKALERMKVPYRIVIEKHELGHYSSVIDKNKILVLPFSNLGQGSIPARNWVWEHSIEEGHKYHWILDDNISWFAKIHNNKKIRITSGVCFRVVEDFVLRYTNIALAGLQYEMFLPARKKHKPFIENTRIYSCILIDNSIPYRWRGRYNEDTDLSLRALKHGYCTALIQVFCCKKMATMTMKGGNTDELYAGDGRLEMAKSLRRQHPDVTKIKWKYGRWHHEVDYSRFKRNQFKKRGDFYVNDDPGYGLSLRPKKVWANEKQ